MRWIMCEIHKTEVEMDIAIQWSRDKASGASCPGCAQRDAYRRMVCFVRTTEEKNEVTTVLD